VVCRVLQDPWGLGETQGKGVRLEPLVTLSLDLKALPALLGTQALWDHRDLQDSLVLRAPWAPRALKVPRDSRVLLASLGGLVLLDLRDLLDPRE